MIRVETVPADDMGHHADAIGEMLSGRLSGLRVRGVFPTSAAETLMNRLSRNETDLEPHPPGYFKGFCYGRVLCVTDDLDAYFDEAQTMDQVLNREPDPLRQRLESLLRSFAGGRAVSVPKTTDGRLYAPVNVRVMEPGGCIAAHSERADWPTMKPLHELIDFSAQLSFYGLLARPEDGGRLVLYAPPKPGHPPPPLSMDASAESYRLLESFGSMTLDIEEGDLVMFDGGRYNHRVTPVLGARRRWTMGGFMALSKDHATVYYWS